MKLLMLRGLPASGKSTFARKLAESGYTRVNKDDLRAMMHNSKWSKTNEKQVVAIRDLIVAQALDAGRSVVVDDTNFAPRHAESLKELAGLHKATFGTKFFDTPLDVCIERDKNRENSVGEKVIRGMYNQYLKPEPVVYKPDRDLPEAIICDIDGTLAHMKGRSPYEWDRVGEDVVDFTVWDILIKYYYAGTNVILVSGRDESCRDITEDWLNNTFDIPYTELHMRPEGSMEKDTKVKRDLYDQHIEGKYKVLFVLDDRDQVVDMWRNDLGLKVLQVAPGNF